MHRALHLQEILLNVFGHCCPAEPRWMPSRRSFTTDLAVLARTCRTFKEPALDVLWFELVDLSPLARCLPDICQSVGPCYSFKRHLSDAEWDALRSYTRRIWHINGYSNHQGWLDNDNFVAICDAPVKDPLFPNLRSCYWQGGAMIPVANIAVPSLTTLDLHFTYKCVPVLKDFLDSVAACCPGVHRLRIHVFHCRIFHDVISGHLCRWANLQVLDFHGIVVDAGTVSRLSEIPALTYVSFTLIPGVADWIPSSGSPTVFSRLIHFQTTSESLESVTGLLSCTRLPVLQNLIVVCPRRPSKETFRSYVMMVRNVCTRDVLVNFMLFNSNSPRFPPWLDLADNESDERLTLDDLRPCMDFVHLCQMRVDVKWSVALTDDDLLTLVSAWPCIQYLHVNERWGWRTNRGGITLRGLMRLLETRHALSLLCVALDTSSFIDMPEVRDVLSRVTRSPAPTSVVPQSTGLLRVLLTDSVIDEGNVPALVDVFVALASYLQLFIGLDCLGGGHQEGAVGRRREWCRVVDGVSERLAVLSSAA